MDFHLTRTGRAFYERDVPHIRDSLERIAQALQRLVDVIERVEAERRCGDERS